MLELKNVRKAYHSKPVLQIPSLILERGIYWVKGANGCGKTTLLKIIAGLLPFEGDVVYKNIGQKKNPVRYRQHISWAEAEPLYPSFLTGSDLIALYSDIRNIQKKEKDSLPELFSMTDYIDDPIGTYSAGMTKKLSLLLAFIGYPSVCVLDEPFITLDEHSCRLLSDLIHDRNRNNGITFIMSSHQQAEERIISTGKELHIINQQVSFSA